MKIRFLQRMLLSSILFASIADTARAQTTEAVIDDRNPPAGYVAARGDGPQDVSMAKYAPDSFLDGEEGVVDLRVLIRRDGSVTNSEIQRSSGSARLDKYARDLVKDWRFQPASLNGSLVDSWHLVSIVWALQTMDFDIAPQVFQDMWNKYFFDPASANRLSGTATVRFLVGRDGKVRKAVIDKPSGYAMLDSLTARVFREARYSFPSDSAGDAVWLRASMTWNIYGDRIVQKDDCFQNVATSSEVTITACSRALAGTSLTPYQRAKAYVERGEAHLSKREIDQAIADFDAGIRISPGVSDLFISRARARFMNRQIDSAMSDLDSAVMVEPRMYRPYVARAEAELVTGHADKAMADYRNAITMVPTSAQGQAYGAVCNSLATRGHAQEALAGCDKSISLEPANEGSLITRGFIYLKLQQYGPAISDFNAVLRSGVRSPGALYGRGLAKLKSGDRDGTADLESARAIDPQIAQKAAPFGVAP